MSKARLPWKLLFAWNWLLTVLEVLPQSIYYYFILVKLKVIVDIL